MNSITFNVTLFEIIIFVVYTIIIPIANMLAFAYVAHTYSYENAFWYFIISTLMWAYGCISLTIAKLKQIESEQN